MSTCCICGDSVGFNQGAGVLTLPWTPEERMAWYRHRMGTDDIVAINLAQVFGVFAAEAPHITTYTICRPCIQPVLHARMPTAAACQEQYER